VGGFAFFLRVSSIGVLAIPFGKGKTEKDEAILFYAGNNNMVFAVGGPLAEFRPG
jgi:hypothetical protein